MSGMAAAVVSLYEEDPLERVHRGAIYEYRPIPWLEPPLWLLRNVRLSRPAYASLYRCSEVSNAFRMGDQNNEESVMARAKRRYIVVLTADVEAQHPTMRQILVAPAYTFHETGNPSFVSRVRESELPYAFYLPEDPYYPDVGECYLDFRQIQPVHRGFLKDGKLGVCLTPTSIKAVLQCCRQYLRI